MTDNVQGLNGTFTLHNGVEMPYIGLGTYLLKNGKEVINAVQWALDAGYRHIDTASFYGNETGVGQGIRESSLRREEVFLVSKVWNDDQGYDATLKAFETSLSNLQIDYLDLYLVHWPVKGKYLDTWRALEHLYKEKKVRAIGLSNFLKHQLVDVLEKSEIVPMVNQMEFHPYLIQQKLVDFCKAQSIQYEAWSPFMQGKVLGRDDLQHLAQKYDKTIAQIVLRWNLQKGIIPIPKSSKRDHILSNADIFGFLISDDDMHYINNLDRGEQVGPDPDNFDF